MILQDDGPHEAQDDGRLSIDDVGDVDVDQFDLKAQRGDFPPIFFPRAQRSTIGFDVYRFVSEERQAFLDVDPVPERSPSSLPTLTKPVDAVGICI